MSQCLNSPRQSVKKNKILTLGKLYEYRFKRLKGASKQQNVGDS